MQRDSFIFYASFWEAIKEVPRDVQGDVLTAIIEYGLSGATTKQLKPIAKAMFTLIKPQLDANHRRFENGIKGAEHGGKGGRPKTENDKPIENPKETPRKPLENPKLTPNVNVNVNENVNGNDNEFAGANFSPSSSPTDERIYLTIDECRQRYDELYQAAKEAICMTRGLKRDQLSELQTEFDNEQKAKTQGKVFSDYPTHFVNWLNTPHGNERIKIVKQPKQTLTDEQQTLARFGFPVK